MENLSVQAPAFMQTMARFKLDMQMGVIPDPVRMNEVADKLETALDSWEGTIGRMGKSSTMFHDPCGGVSLTVTSFPRSSLERLPDPRIL